ncbi:MAG TPA: DUF6174 domain-containing protein [Gemmatimonadaceae bacterium]|nr:DUF6174 domain-containing protein [Gemmatimonadaceae bacterium]
MHSRVRLIAVAMSLLACHRHTTHEDVQPPPNDTRRVVDDAPGDPAIAALFSDTTPSNAIPEGRDYRVQNAAERQALQATLRRERALWQAAKPAAYRFLSRSDCFCPGPQGWLLVEVRPGQLLRAWDKRGRVVDPRQWYTFTIDNLFDNLERVNDQQSQVQIAFDQRWHYPRYLRTSMIFPDGWGVTQIRGFHPL